jgi:2-methylcitrate dehydratase PrpD
MSLTGYVVDWAMGLKYEQIPAAVLAQAREHIIDGYGLALSGFDEESHAILRRQAARAGGIGEATLLGTPLRAPAETAALVNGLAMHAMDYDDTQLSTNPDSVYGLLTHPTTPVLAAALAAAELVHASGRELITAYVAGIEVACRIADAMNPRHYHDGFHTTGTVGAFGAAAAAGRLLGLTRDQMLTAFAIAAPLGGGYRENFGTMTKPLHAGLAAKAGIEAARLAQQGFTAAQNILEAKRGFYRAAAGGYEPARIEGKLGNPFFFVEPGISIKPYPCGSLSHPGIDATLALVREHDVRPEDVVEAVSATNSAMTNALIYALPQTALEAKFSFPFFLAISILKRKAGLAEFKDEVVRSAPVQEMMKRCRHVVDPEIEARGYQHMETLITIRLRDGRVLSRREMAASGHPLKPMTREQLEGKYFECTDLAVERSRSADALGQLWQLESVRDAAELNQLLAGERY